MKKSDLKVFMLVQYRSGEFRLVAVNRFGELIGVGKGPVSKNFNFDEGINEDLTARIGNVLDIVKVYSLAQDERYTLSFDPTYRDLLWERVEVKEMTLAEISQALGYEVKVVK